MQNRNKALAIGLLFVFLGAGLVGYGIYYNTKPLPCYMSIMSAGKKVCVSSKDSAAFLTAISSSRPWDATLAKHAINAKQQADGEERPRLLITTLFVIAGIVLGVFGGRRIAIELKKRTVVERG